MGKYINVNSKGQSLESQNKAEQLVADGAKVTSPSFKPNLVCVVRNGEFDAACFIDSKREFEGWNDPRDYRQKTWLTYEHAEKLAR